MLKVLITGITGRVGANIAQNFLSRGHAVTGLVWPGDNEYVHLQSKLYW